MQQLKYLFDVRSGSANEGLAVTSAACKKPWRGTNVNEGRLDTANYPHNLTAINVTGKTTVLSTVDLQIL